MKLLILTRYDPFASYSGTEVFARNLTLALRSLGHELHVVYGSSKLREKSKRYQGGDIHLHEIKTIGFPFFGSFEYFVKSGRLIKKLLCCAKFDAIIVMGAGQGLIFHSLKKILDHPLLVYFAADCMQREGDHVMRMLYTKNISVVRRLMTELQYFFLTRNDRMSCHCAELILTSSKDTKRCLNHCYNVPPEKTVVSYEGVSDDFSHGFEKTEPKVPTFLHVATSHERKGTFFLFQAIKIVKDKYRKDVKVVVTGPKDRYYLGLAKELDINVSFVGRPKDLRPLYASCTALVVPSVSEGFCLPVIEAAAFGKPAIVSNAGSLPELVGNGVDGYVVPIADANSLAEKMYELVTDNELRRRMSMEAERKAENFKISTAAQRFIEIIEKTQKAHTCLLVTNSG